MEFLSEYGLFLAKAITVVIAVVLVIVAASAASGKGRRDDNKELKVEHLNEKLLDLKEDIESVVLSKEELKQIASDAKKKAKQDKKKAKSETLPERKPRTFVLDFDGDVRASAVESLREAVTGVLQIADKSKDEVVVRLESPGGMVHAYGLAAAQLDRIKASGLTLTACVDKVAASGGYMMACVADKIIASPFAVMGSIGVVAQLPNFHRLLKKNDVDFEVLTAGEHKRTLTVFGENTDKGREKFQEDLEDTHELFKAYVSERRPSVDIEAVANGDIWFGQRAKEVNLVDELATSDQHLVELTANRDVYEIAFKEKPTLVEKLGFSVESGIQRGLEKALSSLSVFKGMR